MRFYELRVIVPPEIGADGLEVRAKGIAEDIDTPIKIVGATIHARPTEGYSTKHDGTIFLIDEGDTDNRNFYTFAGHMAYMYGMAVVNVRKFGDKTLSLKEDMDAVNEFIENTLDTPGFGRDQDDADFVVNGDEDEKEETFTSNIGEDLADE